MTLSLMVYFGLPSLPIEEMSSTESHREVSHRRVAIHRNLDAAPRWYSPAADLSNASKDRSVEVAGAAFFADADRHILEDYEVSLMPQRLALDPPLVYGAIAV